MPIFMRIVHATIHANHLAAYFHVNNRPIWKVPQMSNDKHIQFTGTDWITNGQGSGILSHDSNSQYPPDDDINAIRIHNIVPGIFHVNIKCAHTNAPTQPPTNIPTYSPTIAPTNNPTFDPTYYPTTDPSYDPPTIDPTYDQTFDPTNDPTYMLTKYLAYKCTYI